jgi:hypothetical protein
VLAQKITDVSALDELFFLENSTIYPFVRTFMSPIKTENIIDSVANGTKVFVNSLGFNRIGVKSLLKYCPYCANEDHETIGFPYWRRSHQLPNVSVCHIHGVALCKIDEISPTNARFTKLLPPVDTSIDYNCDKSSPEFRYALWCHWLLITGTRPYGPEVLYNAFRASLYDKGYISKNGRLRISELREHLIDRYGDEYLLSIGAGLNRGVIKEDWLKVILRRRFICRNITHYIVLIGFLFDTIETFHSACLVADNNTLEQLRPEIHNIRNNTKCYDKVINLLKNGHTLSEIKSLVPIKIDKLTSILENYRSAIDSEYREKMRARCRETISDAIRKNPNMTRTDFWKISKCAKAINWLKNNDQKWLNQVMPAKTMDRFAKAKELSNSFDVNLAADIERAANQIKSYSPPVRVSYRSLSREFDLRLDSCSLKSRPFTLTAIKTILESQECYGKRRVEWAIKDLRTAGEKITYTAILNKAGFKCYVPDSVSELALQAAPKLYTRRPKQIIVHSKNHIPQNHLPDANSNYYL